MSKYMLAAGIGLLVAVIMAAGLMNRDEVAVEADRAGDIGRTEALQTLQERLLSIEQLLAEEREARLELEGQLQGFIDGARVPEAPARTENAEDNDDDVEGRTSPRRSRDFVAMMRSYEDRRLNSLIKGGFTEDEARRVVQRESQAEFEAMRAAWDAQRNGEAVDPIEAMVTSQSLLRSELGEADYERYLAARGQQTSIQVTRVIEGSPGSDAGLQPGDQIVSYGGERVYSVGDLRSLTLQGTPGEDVVVEIDRDGVRMQLSVPRGPVGISGSGASIRNLNWFGGS
jgi:hypothetical protein